MDAFNTKKTTAISLVVLMVGSAFAALVPTVGAHHAGDIDVTIARDGGRLAPDFTYDITMTNLPLLGTGFDQVALYEPLSGDDCDTLEPAVTTCFGLVEADTTLTDEDDDTVLDDVVFDSVAVETLGTWRVVKIATGSDADALVPTLAQNVRVGSFTVAEAFGTTTSPGGGLTILRADATPGDCDDADDDDCAEVTFPADGALVYNNTYDLRFTAVPVAFGDASPSWIFFDCVAPESDPDACVTDWIRVAGGTGGRTAADDIAHPGHSNYTFVSTALAHAGEYILTTTNNVDDPTPGLLASFWVEARSDLTVTATPSTFAFDPDASFSSVIAVTSGGNALRGATVSSNPPLPDLPDDTRADGRVILFGDMPPVGVYTITAEKSVSADETPDVEGTTAIRVTAGGLDVENVATSAIRGFSQTVSFIPTLPGTDDAVLGDDFDDDTRWLIRITGPHPTGTGTMIWESNTTADTLDVDCEIDGDTDEDCIFGDDDFTIDLDVDAAGELSFTPTSHGWRSGTYTFLVGISTTSEEDVDVNTVPDLCEDANGDQALDSEDDCLEWLRTPEHRESWTLSPGAPAAVNIEFFDSEAESCFVGTEDVSDGAIDCPDEADTLDVLGLDPNVLQDGAPDPQGYTVMVRVSGDTEWEHPLCRLRGTELPSSEDFVPTGACDPLADALGFDTSLNDDDEIIGVVCPDAAACEDFTATQRSEVRSRVEIVTEADFLADNVTLRGDVLDGWTVTDLVPDTGVITIEDVVPTRNGTIFVDVDWKGRTTTLTIPVNRGAVATADVSNITVDTETRVTVHVETPGGQPSTTAVVSIFKADGGLFEGEPSPVLLVGNAQANRGANGNYVFELTPDTVGDLVVYADVGSGISRNFSYFPLTVVPARDLEVNLSVTEAMAANLTHVKVNVTNATNIGLTGGDDDYSVFFLNEEQTRDLVSNGTSSLFDADSDILPVAAEVDDEDENFAHFNVSLEGGTYTVYVCAAFDTGCVDARHDNRENMPTFVVHPYVATFTPSQISAGADLESDVEVTINVVDADGNPANGQIRIFADDDAGATDALVETSPGDVDIEDGVGTATLTGVAVGDIRWQFNPEGAPTAEESPVDPMMLAWAGVTGSVRVTAGNITVSPSTVTIGTTTVVTVTVKNTTGAGLAGRNVALCSRSLDPDFPVGEDIPRTLTAEEEDDCTNEDVTTDQGVAGITVTPTGLAPIRIYVNGTYSGIEIPVVAGRLNVALDPENPTQDGTVTITVTQPGGGAAGGTPVVVARDGTQVLSANTSSEGEVVLTNLQAGNYTVTAKRAGFLDGVARFSIGRNVTPPPPAGARFELSNLVAPAAGTVGVSLTVSADLRNTGQADGTATVLLLVNGAVRDTRSIPVSAGGNETVAFDFAPNQAGAFRVTVKLASGETLAERTVTVAQQTTTQPTGPTQPTPPVVTPTPPAATPRVPGFEVVALLGALVVALVVLRRRN